MYETWFPARMAPPDGMFSSLDTSDYLVNHFVHRKPGRVQHLGIGGRLERARFAGRVDVVPTLQAVLHFALLQRVALRSEIELPPARAFLGGRREEDLHFGCGKIHGSDVSTLHHRVARVGQPPLLCDERRAHRRNAGDRAYVSVDLR